MRLGGSSSGDCEVSYAAPAPVVECIAFAAVVYAAQAIVVEWIDMYVAIPEFLAVVPRSQEWSAEGTAAPAASAAPAPVAPASTVEGVHCHGYVVHLSAPLDGKSRCARYPCATRRRRGAQLVRINGSIRSRSGARPSLWQFSCRSFGLLRCPSGSRWNERFALRGALTSSAVPSSPRAAFLAQ